MMLSSNCCYGQRIRADQAPLPAVPVLTLTVRTGSPPTGRQKAEPARTSRWKRELCSCGDFSRELLLRATDPCGPSTAPGSSGANFNSSHGKSPNGTAESGARENEPLETRTPFVRRLLARIVATGNGSMQPKHRTRSWKPPRSPLIGGAECSVRCIALAMGSASG